MQVAEATDGERLRSRRTRTGLSCNTSLSNSLAPGGAASLPLSISMPTGAPRGHRQVPLRLRPLPPRALALFAGRAVPSGARVERRVSADAAGGLPCGGVDGGGEGTWAGPSGCHRWPAAPAPAAGSSGSLGERRRAEVVAQGKCDMSGKGACLARPLLQHASRPFCPSFSVRLCARGHCSRRRGRPSLGGGSSKEPTPQRRPARPRAVGSGPRTAVVAAAAWR